MATGDDITPESHSTTNENTQPNDASRNHEPLGVSSGVQASAGGQAPKRHAPTVELPSKLDVFSNGLKLDIRAHQRTYEGAYTRTAIGCFAFSILIIKIFSKEFLPIGTIYTIYGSIVFIIGFFKSRSVDFYYNPDKDKEFFKTSGNSVILLTSISLICYVVLFVLIMTM